MKVKERLVISSLVLLFNFIPSSFAEDEGSNVLKKSGPKKASLPLKTDQYVFRLSGRSFSLNELKKVVDSLQEVSCLGEDNLLSQFLDKDFYTLKKSFYSYYNSFKKRTLNDSINYGPPFPIKVGDQLLLIEKLKLSALGRAKDELDKEDLKFLSPKCSNLSWAKLPIEARSLFLCEYYLKERFGTGSDEQASKELKKQLIDFKESLKIKEPHEFFQQRTSGELSDTLKFYLKSKKVRGAKEAKNTEGKKDSIELPTGKQD